MKPKIIWYEIKQWLYKVSGLRKRDGDWFWSGKSHELKRAANYAGTEWIIKLRPELSWDEARELRMKNEWAKCKCLACEWHRKRKEIYDLQSQQ